MQILGLWNCLWNRYAAAGSELVALGSIPREQVRVGGNRCQRARSVPPCSLRTTRWPPPLERAVSAAGRRKTLLPCWSWSPWISKIGRQRSNALPYQHSTTHITTNQDLPMSILREAATGQSGLSVRGMGPLGEPVRQLPSCGRSFLHVDASKIGQLLRNVVSNSVRVPSSSAISATISLLTAAYC